MNYCFVSVVALNFPSFDDCCTENLKHLVPFFVTYGSVTAPMSYYYYYYLVRLLMNEIDAHSGAFFGWGGHAVLLLL